MNMRSLCSLSFAAVVWMLFSTGTEAAPPSAETNAACMVCHSIRHLVADFKNNEKVSVFVNERTLRNSVHANLRCTDCHTKLSPGAHPAKVYQSRTAFILDTVAACRPCHPEESLTARPDHAFVSDRTNAPPCTTCHGGHNATRVAALKNSLQGSAYCLLCHRYNISTSLKSGERLSLYIDTEDLTASVHNNHTCSDCHADITKENHPPVRQENLREHSVAVSRVCARCHRHKAETVKEGIHYNLSLQVGETTVRRGNPLAPVCTDCHGFHAVGPKALFETLSGVPCRKCHESVFDVYARSVHGMARARGQRQAPVCSSCHFAHEIKFSAITERVKAACLDCHPGVGELHKKWLSNAELHLSVVACAACHAPAAGKGIYLILYDETTGKPFTSQQLYKALGINAAEFSRRLQRRGGEIDPAALSGILSQLNQEGTATKVTYLARMDVTRFSDAHRLSNKGEAVRECGACHSRDARFLKNVTLAILDEEAGVTKLAAEPGVLTSPGTVVSLGQFYMIRSTSLRLLDWLGMAVIGGALFVVFVHLVARVAAATARATKGGGTS